MAGDWCIRCGELQRMMYEWLDRAAATDITEANVELALEAMREIMRKIKVHESAVKTLDRPCFGARCYRDGLKGYSWIKFKRAVLKKLEKDLVPEHFDEDYDDYY